MENDILKIEVAKQDLKKLLNIGLRKVTKP